jgi:NAD(P)-dependent dehydrogenase (short-subunit alcohol dehydrogenase family)
MAAAGTTLAGRVAAVVGGTSGIGAALAHVLAARGCTVVIGGRSHQKADMVIGTLANGSVRPHTFLEVDCMRMRSVADFCDTFRSRHHRLDYLVLTPGHGTMEGRCETEDGLDAKLQVNYYARVALIERLMPVLEATAACGGRGQGEQTGGNAEVPEEGDDGRDGDVRVLSVLSAGVHSQLSRELMESDPELRDNFSLVNAANHAGTFNDLAVDALSREHPGITFAHAAPGMVNTDWGSERLSWYARPVVRLLLGALGRSADTCAEKLAPSLLDAGRRGGWHLVNPEGGDATKMPGHDDELRGLAWTHTKEVLKRTVPEVAEDTRS